MNSGRCQSKKFGKIILGLTDLKSQEKASNRTLDSDSVVRNGLDEAIAEEERGEVEVFDSFDDFKAAMARWQDNFVQISLVQRKSEKWNLLKFILLMYISQNFH